MDTPAPTRSSFFTTHIPADNHLWTAGFFNERFPDVVSPLGWSVVRRLVEQAAFREPLSFVGCWLPPDYPLIKLYCGHVYTNVGAFQRLYRVFPAPLVPRGAGRYFPSADTSLRFAVPAPSRATFLKSAARTFVTEAGWHPFNYVVWERFVKRFDSRVAGCLQQIEASRAPSALLRQVDELMALSLDLLRLHRWSLTYADVLFDLLRRLVSAWVDAGDAEELTATLLVGRPNRSTETDAALWRLAQQATALDADSLDRLRGGRFTAFLDGLDATSAGRRFAQSFHGFLADYGHRSPSLDLRYPAYVDDPAGVLALIAQFLDIGGEGPAAREHAQEQRRLSATRHVRRASGDLSARWWLFRSLLSFAQRYTALREDQRYYWQKSMYGKRQAFLRIGQAWASEDMLARDDDIFFLTLDEITGVVRGWLRAPEIRDLVEARRTEFEVLHGAAYPPFLQGQVPLSEVVPARGDVSHELLGLPASPGRARGPALVVSGPAALDGAWQRLLPNSVLVTGSTDPAWTPLFLRVRGLVMERGGQLSHGAVVAREYGLPAVVGVAGALDRIADGQIIDVDGATGRVTLLPA
ncbi:MAG: PEP-utilizing enzyme [Anaerolineae bacterium]